MPHRTTFAQRFGVVFGVCVVCSSMVTACGSSGNTHTLVPVEKAVVVPADQQKAAIDRMIKRGATHQAERLKEIESKN